MAQAKKTAAKKAQSKTKAKGAKKAPTAKAPAKAAKGAKTTKVLAKTPKGDAKTAKGLGKTGKRAPKTAKALAKNAKGDTQSPKAAPPARAKKRARLPKAPKWTPQERIPFAELQARKEVVMRALDDVHQLMVEADPVNAPADFKEREKKAFALLEEINSLVPPSKPMTAKERARLEKELEDKPDDATLRAMLLEMEKMVDDPALPLELRALISREQIQDALRSLDEVALLTPIVQKIHTFLDDLRNPKPRDPRATAIRIAIEQEAARRRS